MMADDTVLVRVRCVHEGCGQHIADILPGPGDRLVLALRGREVSSESGRRFGHAADAEMLIADPRKYPEGAVIPSVPIACHRNHGAGVYRLTADDLEPKLIERDSKSAPVELPAPIL